MTLSSQGLPATDGAAQAAAPAVAPPFRRILVPLDGSRLARAILPPLQRLLGDTPAEVTLVRVAQPNEAVELERGSAAEAAMKADLEQARAELGEGLTARVELLHGDPAQELLRASSDYDLVAMATHGRTGLDRWVRGSVAERVLRSCQVPLLLCNPHTLVATSPGRLERIVVPLDGSSRAASVLPTIQSLAAAHDAHVMLLTVEVPVLTDLAHPVGEDAEARSRAVRSLAEGLSQAGLRADVQEAFGPVASEILQASRRADLLAMSTHGRSGPSRWWFGSVAEEVLRRVACPLLLVVRGA